MTKLLILIGTVFFLTQSNIPLKTFNKISGMENKYSEENRDFLKHQKENHYGDLVLDVRDIPFEKQKKIWNKSKVKNEFLNEFPSFNKLANFIKERVMGEPLKRELLERLSLIQDDFIAGNIDSLKAKREFLL